MLLVCFFNNMNVFFNNYPNNIHSQFDFFKLRRYHKCMKEFFKFKFTAGNLIRLAVIALASWLIFGYLLLPCVIDGPSMQPTYSGKGINFCNTLPFFFRQPQRGEVVIVRYGLKKMLLKRVVALAGETVEFKNGKLLVNGRELDEPYVKLPSDWNLPPRLVEDGSVYVVGDNRSMPISVHIFGQTRLKNIAGKPLW